MRSERCWRTGRRKQEKALNGCHSPGPLPASRARGSSGSVRAVDCERHAAAAAAYGWPADIAEEEALARLLALNLERSGPQ
jgi:hypothetical protein